MQHSRRELKGIVVGTVLGDSCLTKHPRCTNYRLQTSHTAKNRDLLEAKAKDLETLTGTKIYEHEAPNGKMAILTTQVHPFYTKLRERMYHDGRKTVDEHVMKALTPKGLAYWYCDDGTLSKHEGFDTPFLCTHHFNRVENELMARMLVKNFGLEFRVNKDRKKGFGTNDYKLYYWLRLRRKDRERFFDLIREFIPESMKYKITPTFDTVSQHVEQIDKICPGCKKTFSVKPSQAKKRVHCSHDCYSSVSRGKSGTRAIA